KLVLSGVLLTVNLLNKNISFANLFNIYSIACMIAFLKGNLIQKSPTSVIVYCNNIGYQVHISLNTYSKIQNLDNCLLHTHFHISENAQTLYGFADELEKNLFIQLISVSGIGPSTARMALSSLSPSDIKSAISRGDVRAVQ